MQEECDKIYSAVLHNTLECSAAKRQLNEASTPFLGMVYGPELQDETGKKKIVLLYYLWNFIVL